MFIFHISPENSSEKPAILSISVSHNKITAYVDHRQYSKWEKLPLIGHFFTKNTNHLVHCTDDYLTKTGASYFASSGGVIYKNEHRVLHESEADWDTWHIHIKLHHVKEEGPITASDLDQFLMSLKKCEAAKSLSDSTLITHKVVKEIMAKYKNHLAQQSQLTKASNNPLYEQHPTSISEHMNCLTLGSSSSCLAYQPVVPALSATKISDESAIQAGILGGLGLLAVGLFAKAFCCKKSRSVKNDRGQIFHVKKRV